MNKPKHYLFLAVMVTAMLLVAGKLPESVGASQSTLATPIGTGTPPSPADHQERAIEVAVPEDIKSVIQSYFEIRYQTFSTLKLGGFGDLTSDSPEAKGFLDAELDKLAVEMKHAELNQLRYVDYTYSLNFNSIAIDPSSQTATISVTEKHDVIFESERSVANPHVARLAGLNHTITLHREQGKWKIVSDDYTDYLWRMLRQTNISPDELLRTMKVAPRPAQRNANTTDYHCPDYTIVEYDGEDYDFGVDYDDTSIHAYGQAERADAVIYAQDYTDNAEGDDEYNLYYPSYDGEDWGDCTNFVSQAIYEGGNASMFVPNMPGPLPSRSSEGQSGWYMLNGMQRASAWNDVGIFYEFVVHTGYPNEGPEGCSANDPNDPDDDVTIDDIDVGDIIQYERAGDDNDGIWDHSVIVVGFRESDGMPLVASHSTDYEEVVYTFYAYDDVRFIHIERSDGMPPVKTFIAVAGDDENTRDCDGAFLGNEVYLGKCDDGESIISGFRFTDVQIPNGATIKYAFITFSVDGTYTSPISLKIYGEASGNSEPFSTSNPLATRPTTSSAVIWDVTEQWDLTDNHAGQESQYAFTTPQLASVLQEIVNQGGWASGNSLSIIIKDNGSATHRRVIAWERADSDAKLFPARLIIAYEGGTTAPTATPTPTNTPTPTPTSTPTLVPSPTPVPTETPVPTNTPGVEPTSPPPWWAPAENVLMKDEPAQEREAFSELLSQIRDHVLKASPKGDAYITVIYQHAPEIMSLLSRDDNLRQRIKGLALEIQPLLESVISNEAELEKPHLEKTWVEKAIVVLDDIRKQASPSLRAEIDWWKAYLPKFAGKTGMEIWEMLPER
jgi:hypothetical protein